MDKQEEKVIQEIPVLKTERLILRKISVDDAEDMYAYASDHQVTRYVTWPTHQTIEDTLGFLRFVEEQYTIHASVNWGIVDKESNKFIGTIGYVQWNKNSNWGEIGYALSREFWGQGLMTEALKPVIQFGFGQMGLNRVEARCNPKNIGSERVMQKVGMLYEGLSRQKLYIKGEYQDLKRYAVLKEDWLVE